MTSDRRLTTLSKAVPLAFFQQRLAADAKDRRRLGLLAACRLQDFSNVLALQIFKRFAMSVAIDSVLANMGRKIFEHDLGHDAADHNLLNDRFQLAYISREVLAFQGRHRFLRNRKLRLTVNFRQLLQEMHDQWPNLAWTLA